MTPAHPYRPRLSRRARTAVVLVAVVALVLRLVALLVMVAAAVLDRAAAAAEWTDQAVAEAYGLRAGGAARVESLIVAALRGPIPGGAR